MARYFATTARGLEAIAARELETLGATEVSPDFTGVHFVGDRELLYKINLWGRIIFRVLVPIAEFACNTPDELYQAVREIDWQDYLTPDNTLAVHSTGGNQQLNHTHFTALQVKNAIADRQRQEFGRRSSVDVKNPDLAINLHVYRDRGILSLDSSGMSLHRRGYRPAVGLAPLKETLAAALLDMAEYEGDIAFFDPLCGSGTLPLEAGLKALKIAPGLFRDRFAFQTWKDYDRALWQKLVQEAKEQQLAAPPAPILGSDRAAKLIRQAKENSYACGLSDRVSFSVRDFSQIQPPCDEGIILCNPPYGKRIGEVKKLEGFYKLLGDVFKQRFTGWTAYILTGNKALAKKIGLKASRRFPVYNGSLACTLLKYELY
ncbi:MAG: THUMP domain-containing protein [Cyanobacteria bacterium P01_E01_bin.42]